MLSNLPRKAIQLLLDCRPIDHLSIDAPQDQDQVFVALNSNLFKDLPSGCVDALRYIGFIGHDMKLNLHRHDLFEKLKLAEDLRCLDFSMADDVPSSIQNQVSK